MQTRLGLTLTAATFGAAGWGGALYARSKDRTRESRREGAEAAALALGWTFAESDEALAAALTQPPFTNGHLREAWNIVTGGYRGRTLLLFDHVCQVPVPGEAAALGPQAHRVAALQLDAGRSGGRLRSDYASALGGHRGVGAALDGHWLLIHQRLDRFTDPKRPHWIDDLPQVQQILDDLVEGLD